MNIYNEFSKVAVYCRVSTDEQQERGTIENQLEFARKYCDLHQLEIFDFYKDDGITGTLPLEDRPESKRLLEDAKSKKFDMILIYKLDRLGRSARVILNAVHTFEELEIKMKSMTEPFDTSNPSGKFMLTMLAGVADLERETILERMWHGTNRAAKEGKWVGGIVPYGYFVNEEKRLEINENLIEDFHMSEKEIVLLVYDLIANQSYSTAKAADYLNALKIPTSYAKSNRKVLKGKRKVNTAGIWRPGQINRIIKNTTYKGVHFYGKRATKQRDLIERKVPAIVSEELWEKSQQVLKDNQLESMRNAKYNYLLRSLIKCKSCGLTYYGSAGYYKCGGRISYRGPLQGKCTSKSLNMYWIEDIVWNDIMNFIDNPGTTIEDLSNSMKSQEDYAESFKKEKQLIVSRLQNINSDKESILDLFRQKIINGKDVENQINKISQEKTDLETRILEIDTLIIDQINSQQNINDVEKLLEDIKSKLEKEELTFELKRKIVKLLVKDVIVDTYFDDTDKSIAKITANYNFLEGVFHTDMDS